MLLLDANLSWRMVKMLGVEFPGVLHVTDTGLDQPATHGAIWDWARSENRIVVTNDEDFLHLFMQKGFPPKIILLRAGNLSARKSAEILLKHQAEMVKLQETADYGILEIY